MRSVLLSCVLFCAAALFWCGGNRDNFPSQALVTHLQNVSVTVRTSDGTGSGVVVIRDGQPYVLTAAHVVADLVAPSDATCPCPDDPNEEADCASDNTEITKDANGIGRARIVTLIVDYGYPVGRKEVEAEIIKYSSLEHGHDLALLKLRGRGWFRDTTTFYLNDEIPPVGTPLYHMGSFYGETGSNSLSAGLVSQHGRLADGRVYDQTSTIAYQGSSGGGMFLRDGRCVGILTRLAGPGMNLMIPVRRIREWARETGIEWVIDPRIPVPTRDQLKKLPVEDAY